MAQLRNGVTRVTPQFSTYALRLHTVTAGKGAASNIIWKIFKLEGLLTRANAELKNLIKIPKIYDN